MKNVAVIDYGMGNIGSVIRALDECGGNPLLTNKKEVIENASHYILPGVGSFNEAMLKFNNLNLKSVLEKEVFVNKKPFLGICVGMQILSEKGYENGETTGLGWIEGKVIKIKKIRKDQRIPHIGWNEVNYDIDNLLFKNIDQGKDFYFVHSYHFDCRNHDQIIGTTYYYEKFVSAINKENIYGVQFHPEKSQKSGFSLLRNFLNIA